jgi:hypothetical protein
MLVKNPDALPAHADAMTERVRRAESQVRKHADRLHSPR